MQFTKAEEYGLLGVLDLARRPQNAVTPLSEISHAQDIPEKFLAKIFQSLSRAGIIRSQRGVRGGFTLARQPETIPVKEVLEAIQGPYHLLKCVPDMSACDRSESCSLRRLLVIAEDRLVEVFQNHTLADLLQWEKKSSRVGSGT